MGIKFTTDMVKIADEFYKMSQKQKRKKNERKAREFFNIADNIYYFINLANEPVLKMYYNRYKNVLRKGVK